MNSRRQRLLDHLAWRRAIQPIPLLAGLTVVLLALSLAVRMNVLNGWDLEITRAVQRWRGPGLDHVAIALTFMGNTETVVTLAFLSAVALAVHGRYSEAALAMISQLALPLDLLLKEMVGRHRPTADVATIVLPALGLSFPSGHAMGAATFYGCQAYIFWVILPRRWFRNLATCFFAALAGLIGMSRVYLGAHWFSDVLGGWTAGIICVVLLAALYRPLERTLRKDHPIAAV